MLCELLHEYDSKIDSTADVEELIRRKCGDLILDIAMEHKEDLKMLNHLTGKKQASLKVTFLNNSDMMNVKRTILRFIDQNKKSSTEESRAYDSFLEYHSRQDFCNTRLIQSTENEEVQSLNSKLKDASTLISELREHDIPFYVRCAIDHGKF